MGSSKWDPGAFRSYSSSISHKTKDEIFTNTSGCHEDLDPAKFEIRESCDSEINPESTPIIIGVDETGSMGYLAEEIIKRSLGVVVEGIYERKPVTDPHVLLAAIGDTTVDNAPLQVTQFEADVKITEQIEKFYLEGCGGGNNGESYIVLWWFALHKTVCDAISKKGRKGYLFTIGDECPLNVLRKGDIKRFLGVDVEADVSIDSLAVEVQEKWNVFHLITPTSATQSQGAIEVWKGILGERAIVVKDHSKLGEVIVSTMQVNEGQNIDNVCSSWDDSTNIVVRDAIKDLVPSTGKSKDAEIVSV